MLTLAIVGAGYWGRNLIRIFSHHAAVRLKYIVDTNPKLLEQYSGEAEVVGQLDCREMLADSEVDAVVIATPAVTHFEIARDALIAGKHVFVEKPMTLQAEHAEELVRIADENNLRLMVGHLLLYHPCIETIRGYITNGDIGDVYYLYCQRLNLGKVRSDENALLSFAPHDISIALYLMGENPTSVSAYGQSYLQEGVEDVVFMNMHFPGNRIAHIHVSWLDPHKVRRTTVVGSKKMVVFDDMEPREKIKIYDKGVEKSSNYGSYGEFLSLRDGNIYLPAIKMTEPLQIECNHFIDCIENGRTPLSDGRNGLMVTKVLACAQRSLKNRGVPVVVE